MQTLPPGYRLFLVGKGISQLGDWLKAMAINWLIVSELQRSSADGNLNRLVVALATILFTLLASRGRFLPQQRRSPFALQAKTVVLLGEIWSMATSALLAVLIFQELLSFWTLVAIGVAGSFVTVLVGPSAARLDRELAGERQLQAALRRDQLMFLMRGVVGVVSGAVLLKGSWLLLAVDACTFLPLIAILLYLRRQTHRSAAPVEAHVVSSVSRGVAIIFANRGLLLILALAFVRDVFISIGFTLTAEVVKNDLKENGIAYGTWLSITGFAGLLGSLLYERLSQGSSTRRLWLYMCCVCGVPIAMIGAGTSPNLTLYIISYALFVFLVSPTDSMVKAQIRLVPTDQIGAVDRAYSMVQTGLCPFLWFVITCLGQLAGCTAQQTLAISATLALLLTITLLTLGLTFARKSFTDRFE